MKKLERALCVFLTAALLLCAAAPSALAAGGDGGFYLAASTGSQTLIEPTLIEYSAGQTVREALMQSEFSFTSLEQGYIEGVQGVADNYYLFYDGGGFDLNADASAITALCITASESLYSEELLSLIRAMGKFNDRTDGVRSYAPAKAAYSAALSGLRWADAASAAGLESALAAAISEYESMQGGIKYTVGFSVTQNGSAVPNAVITMTDAYGQSTTAEGASASVVAGTYTYCVSNGGKNRVEGTVEVAEGGASVSAELPYGSWFSTVELLKATGSEETYMREETEAGARFSLPDTVARTGQLYLYAVQGEDVPDEQTTRLRAMYTGLTGVDYRGVNKSWSSRTVALAYLVEPGMTGRTLTLDARYDTGSGQTQIQSYTAEIVRVPTLSSLSLSGDGTALPLDFDPSVTGYSISTVSESLTVSAAAFGAYSEGYSIAVNGSPLEEGGSATVAVGSSGTEINVAASWGGSTTAYIVNVTKTDAVNVALTVPAGTEAAVYNGADALIQPVSGSAYRLVPGEKYTYIATKNGYYHTSASFAAADGLSVSVAEPVTADWLTELAAANGTSASNKTARAYSSDKPFSPSVHEYTYYVGDCNSTFALWATAAGGVTLTAGYTRPSTGDGRSVSLTSGAAGGKNMTYFVETSGFGNTLTLKVSMSEDENGVTSYQEYILYAARELHIYGLTLSADGAALPLLNGASSEFDRDVTGYTVEVPRAAEELGLSLAFPVTAGGDGVYGGYTAEISCGEQRQTVSYAHGESVPVTLALDTSKASETVTLTVRHSSESAVPKTYTVTVTKLEPVPVSFAVTPVDAAVYLTEDMTGKRIYPAGGAFELLQNYEYSYNVTRTGFVGVSGRLTADAAKTVTVSLRAAPENTELDASITSEWSDFRGGADNNAVTDAPTTITDGDTVLYWANKLGEGYSAGAVGSPILADGYLYTYAGSTIFKVDTVSGEVAATGKMDHNSSFSITPPTYAEGMVFVALANGGVQAFNAATLESLWVYTDPLGGQPNSPITYRDGYIYTGFWRSESLDAAYVCLSATDEDPSKADEAKLASWRYDSRGGFYWAGAYVTEGYMLLGTDDGCPGSTEGYATLLSLDPLTGEVIDSLAMPNVGDIRSSIAYDEATGAFYFTSKGGYFYSVGVSGSGKFAEGSLKWLRLTNGVSDPLRPPMSTSTPTVYNGRAYVGVSGTGQFTQYSGHNITVIDLASWTVAYTVATQGYPQTSGLLTTAYSGETGSAYIYFFDNYTPGKLRVIADKPGQTAPDRTTAERYTENGAVKSCEAGYVLFTAAGEQAQYIICSPITDSNGTIYYKNDSGCLMALGSTIESLTVTAQPTKTEYSAGERFDPTGMTVVAAYKNGTTRDVTRYVTCSADPLTPEDTDFQIRFEHVMYQNKDGETGVSYTAPSATVTLTITEAVPVRGDMTGDGVTDALDAAAMLGLIKAGTQPTAEQISLCDLDGDGALTAADAEALLQALVAE